MKKILSAICLTIILAGCYEDKGNYNYKLDRMNEIKSVSFTPSASESAYGKLIEVQQAMTPSDTVRRIEAVVEQTLATDYSNLHFYWYLRHNDESGIELRDTVETNGYLEVALPVGREKEYTVYLQIYDTHTTLSHYTNFSIKTRPIFKNSLFVLHGEAGSRSLGNIEIIGDVTNIHTDAYGYLYPGVNPFANAEGLSYTTYQDISNTGGFWDIKEVNTLQTFSSNAEVFGYNPFGLNAKFYNSVIMKPVDNSFVYARNIQTGDPSNYTLYRIVLSKDGQMRIGNYVPALYKPGYAIEQAGGNALHQTDYQITAATITDTRYVMWDAKGNRFLYISKNEQYALCESDMLGNYPAALSNPVLDANVDFSTLEKSPVGMRAVYAYIQYRENYAEAKPYFIFLDEASGDFWRYELTKMEVSTEKEGKKMARGTDEVKPAFTITGSRMRNFHPRNVATIVYNSWFTTNYLFYADGGTVYRYSVSNGDSAPLYTAPEGYTVSLLKFRVEDSNSFSDNLGRWLSIGLEKEGKGAVAEILLNTASDVDSDTPALFYDKDDNGLPFGRIKDVQFTQIYMYSVPDYLN